MNKSTQPTPLAIHLNDEPCLVPENSSLLSLIRGHSAPEHTPVAVALNGVIIRRSDWDTQILTPDDHVMLIDPAHA